MKLHVLTIKIDDTVRIYCACCVWYRHWYHGLYMNKLSPGHACTCTCCMYVCVHCVVVFMCNMDFLLFSPPFFLTQPLGGAVPWTAATQDRLSSSACSFPHTRFGDKVSYWWGCTDSGVCVCVCVCVCVRVHVCYVYLGVFDMCVFDMCVCMYMYVCVCTCMYVCAHVSVHVCLCVLLLLNNDWCRVRTGLRRNPQLKTMKDLLVH